MTSSRDNLVESELEKVNLVESLADGSEGSLAGEYGSSGDTEISPNEHSGFQSVIRGSRLEASGPRAIASPGVDEVASGGSNGVLESKMEPGAEGGFTRAAGGFTRAAGESSRAAPHQGRNKRRWRLCIPTFYEYFIKTIAAAMVLLPIIALCYVFAIHRGAPALVGLGFETFNPLTQGLHPADSKLKTVEKLRDFLRVEEDVDLRGALGMLEKDIGQYDAAELNLIRSLRFNGTGTEQDADHVLALADLFLGKGDRSYRTNGLLMPFGGGEQSELFYQNHIDRALKLLVWSGQYNEALRLSRLQPSNRWGKPSPGPPREGQGDTLWQFISLTKLGKIDEARALARTMYAPYAEDPSYVVFAQLELGDPERPHMYVRPDIHTLLSKAEAAPGLYGSEETGYPLQRLSLGWRYLKFGKNADAIKAADATLLPPNIEQLQLTERRAIEASVHRLKCEALKRMERANEARIEYDKYMKTPLRSDVFIPKPLLEPSGTVAQ